MHKEPKSKPNTSPTTNFGRAEFCQLGTESYDILNTIKLKCLLDAKKITLDKSNYLHRVDSRFFEEQLLKLERDLDGLQRRINCPVADNNSTLVRRVLELSPFVVDNPQADDDDQGEKTVEWLKFIARTEGVAKANDLARTIRGLYQKTS